MTSRPNVFHDRLAEPFHEDERWPCGEFVVQSERDRGLPEWTAANRSIEDTDVVLWYVFGIHHITRPEEWPVMAVDTVSFWLKPVGFLDRHPALDVPPTHRHCSTEETIRGSATTSTARPSRHPMGGPPS